MSKDLVEYLTVHLDYEVDMLNRTYDLIQTVRLDTDDDWTVHDALIVSFCTHARALFEFVHKETRRHEYTPTCFACYDRREAYGERLNVQIAHVAFAGRKAHPEDRLRAQDRFEMLRDLHNEWAHFKKSRKSPYDSHSVKDVAVRLDAPIRDTTTGAKLELTDFVSKDRASSGTAE